MIIVSVSAVVLTTIMAALCYYLGIYVAVGELIGFFVMFIAFAAVVRAIYNLINFCIRTLIQATSKRDEEGGPNSLDQNQG